MNDLQRETGSMADEKKHCEKVRFIDLVPAIEYSCWTVVFLACFFRWSYGPAVTIDQWLIQFTLSFAAVSCALFLRVFQLLPRRNSR